jgi:ubiquinone/menaquinone biosynthesis C-methylase UbiE
MLGKNVMNWTGERYVPQLKGAIALEHLHRYAYASEYVGSKVVLDISSGEGYGSHLLSQTATHVYGVDLAQACITHAASKYNSPKISFIQGSCTEIPLPDAMIDVVVSFETIEHLTEHDRMISEIKRVLKPEGLLIISSPEKQQYGKILKGPNPYHARELQGDQLVELLNKNFKHTAYLGQRFVQCSALFQLGRPQGVSKTYQLNDSSIKAEVGLPEPTYLIGICSDSAQHHLKAGGLCEYTVSAGNDR